MQLEFFSALDTGRARSNNEDAVRVDEAIGLAVLADGMGGYNAGEVASAMAVDCMVDHVARWVAVSRSPRDEAEIRQALTAGASHANRTVFEASQSRAEYAGMGTTLVVALFNDARLWVGHIGDSRAYRWRAGRLEQLSRDHSLLQEQIDAGLLTPEEAVFSMNRNLVTRAVGVEPEVELEIVGHEVQTGDTVLLCSDGLSDMLPDPAIAQVMRANDSLATAAVALIAAANAAGGRDNISVVLVHAKGGAAPTGRAWWPFRRA
mgnify:CR=1 FL=1